MIRQARQADWPGIWALLEPVFRAGETYAVDRDISESLAKTKWLDTPAATYVVDQGGILATYYIRANHQGAASHVCNCGYITSAAARGQGLATDMCKHSLVAARALGFTAMQFNMVLASNAGALALWQKLGFDIVGTLPACFDHPKLGLVDGYVMWKAL